MKKLIGSLLIIPQILLGMRLDNKTLEELRTAINHPLDSSYCVAAEQDKDGNTLYFIKLISGGSLWELKPNHNQNKYELCNLMGQPIADTDDTCVLYAKIRSALEKQIVFEKIAVIDSQDIPANLSKASPSYYSSLTKGAIITVATLTIGYCIHKIVKKFQKKEPSKNQKKSSPKK